MEVLGKGGGEGGGGLPGPMCVSHHQGCWPPSHGAVVGGVLGNVGGGQQMDAPVGQRYLFAAGLRLTGCQPALITGIHHPAAEPSFLTPLNSPSDLHRSGHRDTSWQNHFQERPRLEVISISASESTLKSFAEESVQTRDAAGKSEVALPGLVCLCVRDARRPPVEVTSHRRGSPSPPGRAAQTDGDPVAPWH